MENDRNNGSNEWEEVQEYCGYGDETSARVAGYNYTTVLRKKDPNRRNAESDGLASVIKDTLIMGGMIAAAYGLACLGTYYIHH